jgi:hypothetical protein
MTKRLSASVRDLAFAMQAVEHLLRHIGYMDGGMKRVRKALPMAKKLRDNIYSVDLFKVCTELENEDLQ